MARARKSGKASADWAAKHPRDPKTGRFTKSATTALTAAEKRRAEAARENFKGAFPGSRAAAVAKHKELTRPLGRKDTAAVKAFRQDRDTVQAKLRSGKDGDADPRVQALDETFRPLTEDVVVTRRVPVDAFGGAPIEGLASRKVRDAGYTVASFAPATRKADTGPEVRMRISLPEGTQALLMPGSASGELLLARDTSLVVEAVTPDGRGGFDMHLIAVPAPRARAKAQPKNTVPAGVELRGGPGYGDDRDVELNGTPIGAILRNDDGSWKAIDADGQTVSDGHRTQNDAVHAILAHPGVDTSPQQADTTGQAPAAAQPDQGTPSLTGSDYTQIAQLEGTLRSDEQLGELWRRTGYNGRAQLVDQTAMNDLHAKGWTRVYRGIGGHDQETSDRHADQWVNADQPFPGLGVYGNGTHTTTDRITAENHARLGQPRVRRVNGLGGVTVLDMAISPDARVIDAKDLEPLHTAALADLDARLADAAEHEKPTLEAQREVWTDPGRFAVAQGYDVISVAPFVTSDERYFIVQNRSKTAVVDPKPAPAPAPSPAATLRAKAKNPALPGDVAFVDAGDGDYDIHRGDTPIGAVMSTGGNAPYRAYGRYGAPIPGDHDTREAAAMATLEATGYVPHLAAAQASGVRAERKMAGGRMATTNRVTFNDGIKAVRKRHTDKASGTAKDQTDAETVSSLVARDIGLDAPAVHRLGDEELLMDFVSGKTAAKHLEVVEKAGGDYDEELGRWVDSPQGILLGLLDTLTSNADRHTGNWMIDSDDRIRPIDHGMSWSLEYGPVWNRTKADQFGQLTSDNVFTHRFGRAGKWTDNPLSPADLDTLKLRLEARQANFQAIERQDWYDAMMVRLGVIRQHATGTERLLT